MVAVRDLNPSPRQTYKKLVQRATAGNTVAHGVKTAAYGEGTHFANADGEIRFVGRDYYDQTDLAISDARATVATAVKQVADAEGKLAAAEQRISDTSDVLTALETQATQDRTRVLDTQQKLVTVEQRLTTTANSLTSITSRVSAAETTLVATDQKASDATAAATASATAAQSAMDAAESAEARVRSLAAAQGSLIVGGSFEDDLDVFRAYRTASTTAAQGSYVARFVAGATRAIAWPELRASASQKLEVRFQARMGPGTTNLVQRCLIRVRHDDGTVTPMYLTGSSINPALSESWQEYVLRFNQLPATARAVWFETGATASPGSTGWVEIDDVTAFDTASYQEAISAATAAKTAADKAAADALAAQTKANQAWDSASGKSSVRWATTAPQGVGTRVGDLWFQTTSLVGGTTIGQWSWDGTQWRQQKLGHQAIASVDLGTATVGLLNGAYIAAGTVATDRLVVGQGDNKIVDPFFANADISARRTARSGAVWSRSLVDNVQVMRASTAASVQFFFNPAGMPSAIPTAATESWHVSVDVESTAGVMVSAECYNSAGVRTLAGVIPPTRGAGRRTISGVWKPPAGTVAFALYVYSAASTEVRDVTVYGGAQLKSMLDAVVIGPGVIAGPHVNADSVAAVLADIIKVRAENVEVTDTLAARLARTMTAETRELIVTDEAILARMQVLGASIVEDLNVRGLLRGRDAILDGTLDVEQLHVTDAMMVKFATVMEQTTKNLIVTEEAILNRAKVIGELAAQQVRAMGVTTQDLDARFAKISDLAAGNLQVMGTFRSGEAGGQSVVIPRTYRTRTGFQQVGIWLTADGLAPGAGAEPGVTAGLWVDTPDTSDVQPIIIRGQRGGGVVAMNKFTVIAPEGVKSTITSQQGRGLQVQGYYDMRVEAVDGSTTVRAADRLNLEVYNQLFIRDTAGRSYNKTWSSGGLLDLQLGSSSGSLYVVGSARRFKTDVHDFVPGEDFLDRPVVTYRDREAVAVAAQIQQRRAAGDLTPLTAVEHEQVEAAARVTIGRIAEDALGTSAEPLVSFNAEGEVVGYDYAREATALAWFVRDNRKRIQALEAQIHELKEMIA